jgi:hypothetical protein
MNMRKAQWLKKPQSFDEYMLHTVKYTNCGKSSVFFTVGETDTVRLSYRKDENVSCSFVFFHTPHDRIVFTPGRIASTFFGLESEMKVPTLTTEITMKKDGETIVFLSGESEILKIKNPAFLSSASIGFTAEGDGGVEIEAW